MDHSNCPNPEECKVYEDYAKLMDDPDQWWQPVSGRRHKGRPLDTMISLRLDSAQLEALHAAAKVRDMTISRFIRESVLKAAALPYVKIISDFSTVDTYTV